MSEKINSLVEAIDKLSRLQLLAMLKELRQRLNLEEMQFSAQTQNVGYVPTAIAVQEEKTEFIVELIAVGPNKINVIKAVRELTGQGLKECKEFVEAVPQILKEDATSEFAEKIRTDFETLGASIVIR